MPDMRRVGRVGRRWRWAWSIAAWFVALGAIAGCRAADDDGAGTASAGAVPVPAVGDIAYAPLSDSQRLDLYLPAGGSAPYPLVIYIHGGGWWTGDKRSDHSMSMVSLFAAGYAVASMNYRLSVEARFPAQILDVKAAVRWLRAHAGDFGLDPDRFVAAGGSAGGHLAALLGTTRGEASLDDAALGNAGVSSAVSGVVDFFGPVDLVASGEQLAANAACAGQLDGGGSLAPAIEQLLGGPIAAEPALAAAANPITYLRPGRDVPPFFITHGDVDCVVPYQGSVALHEAIEAAAGPGRSQLAIVPRSGHFMDFDTASQVGSVFAFLERTIGPPST
jgi:acetyl esterase/lipase